MSDTVLIIALFVQTAMFKARGSPTASALLGGVVLWLLDDPAIISELGWFFVLAIFPHQRAKPDTTFANQKIGWREAHF